IASGPSQPSDIATAVDAAWTRPWRWSGVAATRAPEMIELTSGVRSSASATITPIRMAAWTTSSIGATAKRSQLPATSAARPLIRRRSGPLANAPSNPPVPGDREHHADRRRRGTALLGEQDREQVEAREKRVAGREQERRGAKVWPPPQPPEPLDRLAPAASLHSPCALARLEVRARQRHPDHRRQKRDCVGKERQHPGDAEQQSPQRRAGEDRPELSGLPSRDRLRQSLRRHHAADRAALAHVRNDEHRAVEEGD